MTTISLCLITLIAFSVNVSLQRRVDVEREKADLLEIHKADRRAHFSTDVDLLLSRSTDDFVTVSDGKIYRVKLLESRKMFEAYFKGATYPGVGRPRAAARQGLRRRYHGLDDSAH